MGRQKKNIEPDPITDVDLEQFYRPLDPAAREQHMISLAVDLAEKKLRDGTATSQIIEHYLRLGTARAVVDVALMQEELELKRAKTEQIRSMHTEAEKYQEAIEAFRIYSGAAEDEEYDESELY